MSKDPGFEILEEFIRTTGDTIDTFEDILTMPLNELNSKYIIENIYDPLQRINGSCSFFGLRKLNKLSESLEQVIFFAKLEKIKIDGNLIKLLHEGFGILRTMLAIPSNEIQKKELSFDESLYLEKLNRILNKGINQKFYNMCLRN